MKRDKDLSNLIKSISQQLRMHRAYRNIGLRSMAKMLGFSSATLSRIEKKGAMSLDNYLKVNSWLAENGRFMLLGKSVQTTIEPSTERTGDDR